MDCGAYLPYRAEHCLNSRHPTATNVVEPKIKIKIKLDLTACIKTNLISSDLIRSDNSHVDDISDAFTFNRITRCLGSS